MRRVRPGPESGHDPNRQALVRSGTGEVAAGSQFAVSLPYQRRVNTLMVEYEGPRDSLIDARDELAPCPVQTTRGLGSHNSPKRVG